MLKKFLSAALISVFSFLTCFAQTAPVTQTQSQLTRAYLNTIKPAEVNFEKEIYKTQTKKNNLSHNEKTILWVSLFAAGVITVVFLATRNYNDDKNSPCRGTSIIGPCPPGCYCTQ